ncbi:cytochrome c oxidase assembly factor 3, mitochondrial [Coccinella septempunctata]|uniref:cytochrome c oxidase assembly factor 3, mitochondrial n=1 Tax=Coccinella septempunctata TaxID=41139 RepID=UPI001D08E958|nr:cytochrome c oxidase assembly factor 3, mitochondrial [Coccinella septempunctata]
MSTANENPKFDKTKIGKLELELMKLIEHQNRDRAVKIQTIRRKNRITGALLGAAVLGIYGYSIYAVKQETFLDDFDEPAKIIEEKN